MSTLGLERPTTENDIRRAYLRGVRAHSPERDPEGFRRIRDAYELLKDSPWLWLVREAKLADASDIVVLPPSAGDPVASPIESFAELPLRVSASEALGAGELERAAKLFLEELALPTLETSFVPSWQLLECVLGLLEKRNYDLAGELFWRFDWWIKERGILPSSLGAPAIARITLIKELSSLYRHVDEAVLQALLASIRSGNFYRASTALATAKDRQLGFQRLFCERAPVLYTATWQHVAPTPQWRPPMPSFPWWRLGFLAFPLLGMVRHCVDDSSHTSRSRAAVVQTDSLGRPANAPSASTASGLRQVGYYVESIDTGLLLRDCEGVRERWSPYRAAIRDQPNPGLWEESVRSKRTQVLARCPELEGKLE